MCQIHLHKFDCFLQYLNPVYCDFYLLEINKHRTSVFQRRNAKSLNKTKEHQYLQNFIKKMAEFKGFKVVIKEPINSKESRIDVGLIYNDIKIAVEISVSNTSNYETGNILKCLNAGYNPVIMCSNNSKHLENIKLAATTHLGKISLNKVLFYSPTELFANLNTYTVENEGPKKKSKGIQGKN